MSEKTMVTMREYLELSSLPKFMGCKGFEDKVAIVEGKSYFAEGRELELITDYQMRLLSEPEETYMHGKPNGYRHQVYPYPSSVRSRWRTELMERIVDADRREAVERMVREYAANEVRQALHDVRYALQCESEAIERGINA